MDHLTLKFLHITAACLFVGNNLVTPFWKFRAERTRDPRVIAYAQRLVTLTDFVFTGSSLALLLATGHVMAATLPGLWQQAWFVRAYACFGLSGLIWLAVLLPVQIKQARLARQFAQGGDIPADYWRLARRWMVAGSLASLLPLASLFFMVVKR